MTSDAENDGSTPSQSPEDSGDQDTGEMAMQPDHEAKASSQGQSSNGNTKTASNAKDPLRPRRKKARRACYACQRAHLTCGDERPCQRCIKRGLQDACHDGVRKKAKYLHDAPNDALLPGVGGTHYQYVNSIRQGQNGSSAARFQVPSPNDVYTGRQAPTSSFPIYGPAVPQRPMGPPLTDGIMNSQTYSNQQSPLSAQFNNQSSQPGPPMQSMPDAMHQGTSTSQTNTLQNPFSDNMFDANDPSQYSFDPASFNFGNHYGALEFGMLGQISSGAGATPPSDNSSLLSQATTNYTTPGTIAMNYGDSPVNTQPFLFTSDQPVMMQAGTSNVFNVNSRNQDGSRMAKQEGPAFSVGSASGDLTSPSATSTHQGMMTTNFEDIQTPITTYTTGPTSTSTPGTSGRSTTQRQLPRTISTPNMPAQTMPSRRLRDPSTIYDSVKQPYPYTTGFHSLTAFIQRRFSPQKTLRIAKALASIRPSFISSTQALNRTDLVFMEKCFQRTLWEYEDFINACGTPTIVCRRTGEVAAVGKEFSILTGWKKDILLGKEPNLNVNTGGTSGLPGTGASSRGGMNTPRIPEQSRTDSLDPLRSQPVFIAELLDDDSVIEFYEDFARLAFGDSRGSVTTRCKLLKYKTKDDPSFATDDAARRPPKRKSKGDISLQETAIDELGEKDGKVQCSYCWTVKRDVFDIPMLIVMNVSAVSWFP
ncbi:Transcriptional regulator of nonfermentable carbon utilization [Loxospora ochrophaea]|nr:Transcriptional regulator of nonfermentable carbon utilization [Loxospora ochrophaea]